MVDFLLVRPSYDRNTAVLHSWADEVLTTIQANGSHICHDISGPAATRSNVEARLRQPIDCFVFYGHGTKDSLEPQGGLPANPAVLDATNSYLLNQKLVCTVACYSARELGSHAVNGGAIAYMGYRHGFWFISKAAPEVWFKRAANAVILHLLASSQANPSCSAAVAHARDVFDEGYYYFRRGRGARDPNHVWAFSYLRWDRDSLTLIDKESIKRFSLRTVIRRLFKVVQRS